MSVSGLEARSFFFNSKPRGAGRHIRPLMVTGFDARAVRATLVFGVPWAAALMIVLNLYNGDILPLHENIEYMLWYLVPLVADVITHPLWSTLARDHVLLLGVACNILWRYQYPFYDDDDIRHRTEYYDTHTLLCVLLYHSLYEGILDAACLHENTDHSSQRRMRASRMSPSVCQPSPKDPGPRTHTRSEEDGK